MARRTKTPRTELDVKFQQAQAEAEPKIEECYRMAKQAMRDAELISEQYGVPYYDDLRWNNRVYVPESLITKGFDEVSDTLLEDAGVYTDVEIETGWASSYC